MIAIWLIAAVAPDAVAQASPDITGRWATDGSEAIVDIQPCQTRDGTLCGRIVWLAEDKDQAGQPLKDVRNQNRALRSRPLVGIEILYGLKRSGSSHSFAGSLYHPEDGRTYRGTLRLDGSVLELKGCALGVFCETETWRRPSDGR